MTNIAILGAGRVGTVLATGLAAAGHSLTLRVRNPKQTREQWRGPEVAFATLAGAARGSKIVVNATPGDGSVATLSLLRSELDGKVLVDVANATLRCPNGLPSGLVYPGSSLAEALQDALPEARVVKTLNALLSPVSRFVGEGRHHFLVGERRRRRGGHARCIARPRLARVFDRGFGRDRCRARHRSVDPARALPHSIARTRTVRDDGRAVGRRH
jgi:hypothetical protein